jgi:glucan phosphoethanolaminetransferase (alkaline phosphatase superfamily)
MNYNNSDPSKNIYIFSFISLIIVIIFMFTPISNNKNISFIAKITSICLLAYSFYLNTYYIKNLSTTTVQEKSDLYKRYLNSNIFLSYIFSLFILVLICFLLKSFWN